MRCIVTGGAGFIGSHTVRELIRRGHSVVVFDDFSSGHEENVAKISGPLEVRRGSVADLDAVREACRGANWVIHLAAQVSVPRSVKDPIETNRINVDGTLNVLVAARDAKATRVVLASSCAVYGESLELPKSESMTPVPITPYGVSKLTAELYAQVFTRAYGLETVSLRYFNVFGPRQDAGSPYSGVLSVFCTALRDGAPVTVYGDGEQSRDFIYVENVVQANLRACEAPQASGLVFNVGTGNSYTLNQTLKLLEKISGRSASAQYAPPRAGDIRDSQADIALAGQKLGYEPTVGFEDGLRRTWEWFKAQGKTAASLT
ncbi:MAG: SDR family oxidoreductase [Candidatus Acidiferrales bacterium]|jgi:UDP-glucose 4-epimerase